MPGRTHQLGAPRNERLSSSAGGRFRQTGCFDDLLRDGVLRRRLSGKELRGNCRDDFTIANRRAETILLFGAVRCQGVERLARLGRAEAASFVLDDKPEHAGSVESVEYVARVDPSTFGDFRFRSEAINHGVDDATDVFEAVGLRNILAFEALASCRHVGSRSLHAERRPSLQKFGPPSKDVLGAYFTRQTKPFPYQRACTSAA